MHPVVAVFFAFVVVPSGVVMSTLTSVVSAIMVFAANSATLFGSWLNGSTGFTAPAVSFL